MRWPFYPVCLVVLALLFIAGGEGLSQSPSRQETHKSDKPSQPKATIQDVAWIAGHWRAQALGGLCEEIWSPPLGQSMMGMFRLVKDGEVVFYEFMTISAQGQNLVLKLKHFSSDLVGWEEKGQFVKFPLLRLTDQAVFFDGLSMTKVDANALRILVSIQGTEHEFNFGRVE